MSEQNWSQHHTFSTTNLHHPETVEQLQDLVRQSGNVKTLGSRHSFNHIADATEDLISLDKLDRTVVLNREKQTAVVSGGITYGELGRYLHREGYALRNMASLPHITVAGACNTATHGSGDQNGCLGTEVAALELVKADGSLVTYSRDQHGEEFLGTVVGLGATGIVTSVTLDLIPSYTMQQSVYENLPLTHLFEHFDDITSSAYSVSFFTHWQGEHVDHVWLKNLISDNESVTLSPTFFDATLASKHLHPLASAPAESCTPQMGLPGPWHKRLPHFIADHILPEGQELQTEYFVPREYAVEALQAIARCQTLMPPVLILSEVRTVAADAFWMSPFYQTPGIGIHFSWKNNWPAVSKVLPVIEDALAPFYARPHWGKLFMMPPQRLQSLYPKLSDFQHLLQSCDPQGKFRNAYLDTYIFGSS